MLIDYRLQISDEERQHLNIITDCLKAIEPKVRVLIDEHRARSKRWYPHELLPWGLGRDFLETEWKQEQSSLRPDVVVALETNLLTEDNLPYYHAQIERMLEPGGVWQEWNRRWTAEEGVHASSMRDYLYLTRAMDPKKIEENRRAVMEVGFDRHFGDPFELFAYTATQELATRVSHIQTGHRADEPIVLKLLTSIARDENLHFVFYRSVVEALLEIAPDLMVPAIMKQLYSFEMPGVGMTDFDFRQAAIANAGIYSAREHRDKVIVPLLEHWQISKITCQSPEAQKAQERLMRLEKALDRMVERQERKAKKTA